MSGSLWLSHSLNRIRRALQLVDSQFSTRTQKRTPSFSFPSEEEARKALMLKTGMVGLAPVPADSKTYETVVRMLVRASRMGEAFQLVKRLREETGACVVGDQMCAWYNTASFCR